MPNKDAPKGYVFVSPGSDPGLGKPLADPIFGKRTTMGACRPDLRRLVRPGDHIFVVSGSSRGVSQYIIGGFAVDEKIDALVAHARFPEHRLRMEDGIKEGNIIVDEEGRHHPLDHHSNFERRIRNYIVGRDQVFLQRPAEVDLGRDRTLEILREAFDKPWAHRVREIIGRNARLNEKQIAKIRSALREIKAEAARARSR